MPDQLSEDLHAAERVAFLEKLHGDLQEISNDKSRQRFYNILIAIAFVVAAFVIWTNRQSLNILKEATGEEGQQASQALVKGLECSFAQAIGESDANKGYTPVPAKPGCPPYTVTIAPRDGQPAQQQTVTAQPTRTSASTQPGGTTYVVIPTASQQPAPQQPQQSSPPTTQPQPPQEEPKPEPSRCALGVAIIGCVVQAAPAQDSLLPLNEIF